MRLSAAALMIQCLLTSLDPSYSAPDGLPIIHTVSAGFNLCCGPHDIQIQIQYSIYTYSQKEREREGTRSKIALDSLND